MSKEFLALPSPAAQGKEAERENWRRLTPVELNERGDPTGYRYPYWRETWRRIGRRKVMAKMGIDLSVSTHMDGLASRCCCYMPSADLTMMPIEGSENVFWVEMKTRKKRMEEPQAMVNWKTWR